MSLYRLRLPLSTHLRRHLTTSSPPTSRSLLSDPQLQAQLSAHSATPTTPLPPSHPLRLLLLSRLSVLTGRPIASDAFVQLDNAEAMAEWYAKNLRGELVRKHGRQFMMGVMGDDFMGELEDGVEVEQKKAEVGRRLPRNLVLDDRIMEKGRKGSVRAKGRGM